MRILRLRRFVIKYVIMFLLKNKTMLTDQKWQFCNYHKNAQIEILNLENSLILIAGIYYLTLNAR